MKVCEVCRYPSGEHARDCLTILEKAIDEMMADSLGLAGSGRAAALRMVEESRARTRSAE